MWLNPKPDIALLCVSTHDQIVQSNVESTLTLGFPTRLFDKGHVGSSDLNWGKKKFVSLVYPVTIYIAIVGKNCLLSFNFRIWEENKITKIGF